jgi:hypothetical protein
MTKLSPIPPEVRAQLAALADRELSKEECRAQIAIPLSPEEIENTLALVHWFRGRYPDVASRLAYARRAHKRWRRATVPVSRGRVVPKG